MVVRLSPSFREGSDVREQEAPNTTAISIHAPAKGATVAGSPQTLISSFQSTLPRRERPQLIREVNVPNTFQSTLPRRERQAEQRKADKTKAFQSTLPRRERPRRCRSNTAYPYFNPRSREGSDWDINRIINGNGNFNPRSREGSDLFVPLSPSGGATISIHAPAKGATTSRFVL